MSVLHQVKSFKGIWSALAVSAMIVAGTFVGIISLGAFLLSVLAIVALKEEDALSFLMLIMPFANIFKMSPQSQSFFTYLMLFYVLWYLLKRMQLDSRFAFTFLLLVTFLVAQMLISINILRTIKFVANILFVYLAVNIVTTDDRKQSILAYVFGVILSSAVAALNIIPHLNSYILQNDLGYWYDELFRFAGLYSDPNYYSINVIISLCLILFLNYHNRLSALWSTVLAALLVMFSIITYSKSAFLMLALPLLLLLYAKAKQKKVGVFVALGVAIVIVTMGVFAGKIGIFDTVLKRFAEADNLSSLTTLRSSIWVTYATYLQEHPLTLLFGSGFGGALIDGKAAHNTYVDILYHLGLVGAGLLAATIVSISKSIAPVAKKTWLNRSVWAAIAIMYFFLSELFYFDWAFHVVLAMWILKSPAQYVPKGEAHEKDLPQSTV